MPKISIIVPVYNVEKYLDKCLRSLVNQSFQDIEILVINDGSTDNSHVIIDKYAALYPHLIKSIVKANGGLADARNYGLRHAKGDYLMFVDSDDWVEPGLCKEMYDLITRYNAQMGVFNAIWEDESGSVLKKMKFTYHPDECIDLKKDFSVFNEICGYAWNKIFKRKLFKGIEFPIGRYYEDTVILIVFLEVNKLVKTDKAYYHYVQRPGSITNVSYTRKHFIDFYFCHDLLIKAFNQSQYKNYKDRLHFYLIRHGGAPLPPWNQIRDPIFLKECFEKSKEFRRENKLPMFQYFFYKRSDGKNHFLNWLLKYKLYYILAIFSPWLLKNLLLARILFLKETGIKYTIPL
ncbi:glycosyltransferase family 2 protein [Bacteroidetes bacterium endosymbiont of Geopemphigus sp.]|uniref:glycosyltransferase family 2 protein n=1 Tax=Bacteroidetes bacterium endosymbiont of Geopemphigus sp. TaxID=2047937 RepID=UPI000CD0AC05|nr:glycosyltransferase family 2 protein [Bacteroidetes bacterium endosymbiont of Geopemphigus sp.]